MNTRRVDIKYSVVIDRVNSHLAMIGKSNSNIDFKNLMITSGQEVIVRDYVNESIKRLISYCQPKLRSYNSTVITDAFAFQFDDTYAGDDYVESATIDYVTNFCLYQILYSKGIELYKKYKDECDLCFENFISNVFFASYAARDYIGGKLNETTGSCTDNNEEEES